MDRLAEKTGSGKATLMICCLLAAVVWAVFGQTLRFDFVNYDDDRYIYSEPFIARGITSEGLHRILTEPHVCNWHPLTSLSHMLDVELSGLEPGGHHRTNVLLHTATTILLFLVLRSLTGSTWRSAFVAAVFAIHPLRAESVAWVSERKDVLSGLFLMLILGAYLRYVRRPFSAGRYGLVLALFALGLMSKAMLVTLPFLLLLLDWWPLKRVQPIGVRRLLLEKAPILLMSAVFSGVTIWAQQKAVVSVEHLSLPWRLGNAACAYVVYLKQTFFPSGLAAHYPHPGVTLSFWQIATSCVLLTVISLAAVLVRRQRPYVLIGWLWYLGMLLPVIGILQVGEQAHADRYSYLPQIGLLVALTWLIADLTAERRLPRLVPGAAAVAVLAALMTAARSQTSTWRDSQALWTHALAQTRENHVAHNNLGHAFSKQEEFHTAMEHYREALRINPDYAGAHYNLGNAFVRQEEVEAAMGHYRHALRINPGFAEAHNNLGNAFEKQGEIEAAMERYREALRIKPDHADAYNNLAWTLATASDRALRNGKRAVELAGEAVRLSGDGNAGVLDTLAAAYAEAGRYTEAVATARRALEATAGREAIAAVIRERLELYQAGRPYHQPAKETVDTEQ